MSFVLVSLLAKMLSSSVSMVTLLTKAPSSPSSSLVALDEKKDTPPLDDTARIFGIDTQWDTFGVVLFRALRRMCFKSGTRRRAESDRNIINLTASFSYNIGDEIRRLKTLNFGPEVVGVPDSATTLSFRDQNLIKIVLREFGDHIQFLISHIP